MISKDARMDVGAPAVVHVEKTKAALRVPLANLSVLASRASLHLLRAPLSSVRLVLLQHATDHLARCQAPTNRSGISQGCGVHVGTAAVIEFEEPKATLVPLHNAPFDALGV